MSRQPWSQGSIYDVMGWGITYKKREETKWVNGKEIEKKKYRGEGKISVKVKFMRQGPKKGENVQKWQILAYCKREEIIIF